MSSVVKLVRSVFVFVLVASASLEFVVALARPGSTSSIENSGSKLSRLNMCSEGLKRSLNFIKSSSSSSFDGTGRDSSMDRRLRHSGVSVVVSGVVKRCEVCDSSRLLSLGTRGIVAIGVFVAGDNESFLCVNDPVLSELDEEVGIGVANGLAGDWKGFCVNPEAVGNTFDAVERKGRDPTF